MKKLWLIPLVVMAGLLLGLRTIRYSMNVTIVPSELQTSTDTSQVILVKDFDGIMLFYDVSALTIGDTLACVVQTQDPLTKNWVDLDTLLNSGDISEVTTVMRTKTGVLGERIRVISTIVPPDSITFSISAILK